MTTRSASARRSTRPTSTTTRSPRRARRCTRAKQLETVPAGAARALLRRGRRHGYQFRNDLRRTVIFGRQRPPPGPADLARRPADLPQHADVLRPAAQERILANFHFALQPGGYLMAGKAEALQSRTQPVRGRSTSSAGSSSRTSRRDRELPDAPGANRPVARRSRPEFSLTRDGLRARRRVAQIVVDPDGRARRVNHAARDAVRPEAVATSGGPLQRPRGLATGRSSSAR